ncbi:MAG: TIGR01906 family membrane protein [Clostridia bacterium]|nr:TIGR01906 family membrane protein [Clostridia bacterium]
MKKILLASALAVVILLSATAFGVLVLHTNDTLYKADVRLLGLTWQTGMDENEIMDNYHAVMDYLSPFNRGEFTLPSLAFSESGAYHFYETRNIFTALYISGAVSFVLMILMLIKLKKRADFRKILGISGILTLIIPIVLLIVIAVDFNAAFIVFHKLFFNNDMWIFDPRLDPVINILPWQFFMHCGIFIGSLWIISALVQLGIYVKGRKRG